MKKVILSAIAVFTFGVVSAQDVSNSIKVNPLSLIGGGTDLLSYEFKAGEKSSILIGAGTGGFKLGGTKYSNSGAEVQYRFYFGDALDSWYAAPQVGYNTGKVKFDDVFEGGESEDLKFSSLKLGAKFGHQWAFDSGFTIDLNIGAAYRNFKYKGDSTASEGLKASGVLPNLGFALGYSF